MPSLKLARVIACFLGCLMAPAARVDGCDVAVSRSLDDLLREASVIIRVRAESYLAPNPANVYQDGVPKDFVRFTVLEDLRRSARRDQLVLPGFLINADDFNDQPVPYTFARPNGRERNCFADTYRRGAQYLLLIKSNFGMYEIRWAPLQPVNEQLRWENDPWVVYVRQRVSELGLKPWEPTAADWEKADLAVRRLEPSAIKGLPDWLVSDLRRRQCLIPQSFAAGEPHNAISGRFNDGDVADWAVLCSRNRVSTVLVFWDGSAANVAEVQPQPDNHYLQGASATSIEYSRAIFVAPPEHIRAAQKEHRVTIVRSPTHDGINLAFLEKASSIWYWSGGKWLHIPDAD